ncbi:hypothetical protein [Aeromonas veronii]|uniref:hypothetical protein n=1 Tax=Aeromonas veronii TaxID=654 RepID=UPI003D1F804B
MERISSLAVLLLAQAALIWRDELRYQQGGVMLADFSHAAPQQSDLFAVETQSPRSEALMQVIDKIN